MSSPADLTTQASAAYAAKDYNKALELFSQAIEVEPSAKRLVNRALTHIKLNDPVKAFDDAQQSLTLATEDSTRVTALYTSALAVMKRGEYNRAISLFNQVLALEPEHPASTKKIEQCKQKQHEAAQQATQGAGSGKQGRGASAAAGYGGGYDDAFADMDWDPELMGSMGSEVHTLHSDFYNDFDDDCDDDDVE